MTKMTPETALEIVRLITHEGKSFRQIAKMPEMPSRSTMQRAYETDVEFRVLVDNARNTRLPRVPEGPTLERQRKGDVVWEALDRSLAGNVVQTRAVAKVSMRIDWYLDRGVITADMHRAGVRMSEIMLAAGKMPRVCVMFRERMDGLRGQNDRILTDKTEAQIALDNALLVLDGKERDAIWDVCALDNFACNTRALVTGLRALVLHFRMIP